MTTPNLAIVQPVPGSDLNVWGDILNTAYDVIDAASMVAASSRGVVADGTDQHARLQTWLDDCAGKAGLLLPGLYRCDARLDVHSDTQLFCSGATLQAPVGSAFPQVAIKGTAGSRLSDVTIRGLRVDMRASVLTGPGSDDSPSGFYAKYVDRLRLIDCAADHSAFEGFHGDRSGTEWWVERFRTDGVKGDAIHIGDVNSGDEISDVWIVFPVLRDSGDDGIGVTAGPKRVVIFHPRILGTVLGAGLDFSGAIECESVGGWVIGAGQHGARIEAYGGDAYDNVIDGLRIRNIAAGMTGIVVTNANRSHVDHPNVLRNLDIDAGAQDCVNIGSNGETRLEGDNTLRTTGRALVLDGTVPLPGGLTRAKGMHIKGAATGVVGLLNANAGQFHTDDSNTFDGVGAMTDNPDAPIRWGPTGELVFAKVANLPTNAALAELDGSTRIFRVPAGARVNLVATIIDAGGAGSPIVELYNATTATSVQQVTYPSGTTTTVDLGASVGRKILAVESTLVLRAGRTAAGTAPGLTIRGAAVVLG